MLVDTGIAGEPVAVTPNTSRSKVRSDLHRGQCRRGEATPYCEQAAPAIPSTFMEWTMARRTYTDDHMIETAAALRAELAPVIDRFGTASMDDFNRARRRIAARAYAQGARLPVMSAQPDHVAELVDLICAM